jgi:hypothetical protein
LPCSKTLFEVADEAARRRFFPLNASKSCPDEWHRGCNFFFSEKKKSLADPSSPQLQTGSKAEKAESASQKSHKTLENQVILLQTDS